MKDPQDLYPMPVASNAEQDKVPALSPLARNMQRE
jgi:hypothetical protein